METRQDAAALALSALDSVLDPELRRPITELGMVSGVRVDDDGVATVGVLLTISGDRKSVV